ncbi:hypothetical protein MJL30_34640, partial [Salmonella enterica subsp. enterica serovar Anatum]|nr:hypothetical protein [Salmonella enterica subsp. enterica serovar Anatum]
ATREARLAVADDVIDNNGAPDAIASDVARLHASYLKLASQFVFQHSLMGSRTDFVDRNNFIILEYREKDPLDVTLWLKADATNEHPECVIEDTPEAAVGL